ncbi:aminotransferase class IV [Vulcanococcus sp.]|jgi:branched-chain amino acid aminotransferase|uniref:aminotransferase class IV n=1 Tax=Vulcanococcus sp. TaxID=2856995 RepID=UPI003C05C9C9
MTATTLAWIDGTWGSPETLQLPLQERGLLLADGLFETVLILDRRPQLLEQHLRRWRSSAQLLGLAEPPDQGTLMPLIEAGLQQLEWPSGNGILRLNWSSGSNAARGLDRPSPGGERFWLQLNAGEPRFSGVTTTISRHERRNASSRLSRCKTFAYGQSIQARLEAQQAGAEDALLLSTTGELCCGTAANLLVHRRGQWLTPPLSSGALPGVMRAQLLERGLARETSLSRDPEPGDHWLLINSLSCRPVLAVEAKALLPWPDPQALWRSLL